jgi:hypothetical protein
MTNRKICCWSEWRWPYVVMHWPTFSSISWSLLPLLCRLFNFFASTRSILWFLYNFSCSYISPEIIPFFIIQSSKRTITYNNVVLFSFTSTPIIIFHSLINACLFEPINGIFYWDFLYFIYLNTTWTSIHINTGWI